MISKKEVKKLSDLSVKKGRDAEGKFLIEGYRIIRSALRNNAKIDTIYVTNKFKSSKDFSNLDGLISEKINVKILDKKIINKICQTVHPVGIAASCIMPSDIESKKMLTNNCLYLDRLSDPGNVGTLLRSAAWFGVKNIALSKECADAFNPKVVRGAMGAHFLLTIVRNMDLSEFVNDEYCIIGADQNGSSIYDFKNNKDKWVLVIGNEANGISKASRKNIQHFLSIPAIGSGNSLNAAVAGSILIHQLVNYK